MHASERQRTPLQDLILDCHTQTKLFFLRVDSDPGPCFELFYLALCEGNELAWEAVYAEYSPLVVSWVAAHPEIDRSGGEIQEYVNRAFARLWNALARERFRRFGDLRSVLAYLKMCVHSVVVEDARRAVAMNGMVALDELPLETVAADGNPAPDRVAIANDVRQRLRSAVDSRLRDERQRLVVHCLYELGLKPRAICARHPDLFKDVHEVYVVRQVALERLRRDPAIRALFEGETW